MKNNLISLLLFNCHDWDHCYENVNCPLFDDYLGCIFQEENILLALKRELNC